MPRHRFELKSTWQDARSHKCAPDEAQGDYDFHEFYLGIMDVFCAWAFAGGVLLILVLLFLV
ncbi:MAG: hypothetical protein OER43_09725 [Gammaproteobacteria bacterium]|nr:hypothetical protein [Gammaproteobacteria bacterium]MDH3414276.1 hypothetical protein [Gammaproteobacteria bacterium]